MKFEIQLYDVDYEEDNNNPTLRPIQNTLDKGQPTIISASSKAELQEMMESFKRCGQIAKIIRQIPDEDDQNGNLAQPQSNSQQKKPITANEPAKIVKIGDILIKYDNGMVFQKQWLVLTENEAKQLRVVNDKTNKLVDMEGKHFEMLKWVQVEENSDDSIDLSSN